MPIAAHLQSSKPKLGVVCTRSLCRLIIAKLVTVNDSMMNIVARSRVTPPQLLKQHRDLVSLAVAQLLVANHQPNYKLEGALIE